MSRRFLVNLLFVFILAIGYFKSVCFHNSFALAASNENSPYGININISIIEEPNPTVSERRKVYKLLREAGVEWVRDSGAPGPRSFTSWNRVEPSKNNWDWTEADKNINLLKEYGFSILGVLGRPAYWARQKDSDLPGGYVHPKDLNQFKTYVEKVVGRYGFGSEGKKQIRYWEVENEPNNNEFYQTYPQKYLDLLKTAYEAAKGVDPNAQIVLGGLGGDGLNQKYNNFEEYLFNHGGANYFDVFNFHAYGWSPAESRGEYGFIPTIKIAKELAQTYGFTDKPIWLTETGSNSSPGGDSQSSDHLLQQQATDLRGRYDLALNTYHLNKVFWFRYKDSGADNFWGTFGILDINLNPKPAYYAYQVTAGGPLPTPVSQPSATPIPTPPPSFIFSPGWNEITWPEISNHTAQIALSDINNNCGAGTALIISQKKKDWWETYVAEYGGSNFDLQINQNYFINVSKDCHWVP